MVVTGFFAQCKIHLLLLQCCPVNPRSHLHLFAGPGTGGPVHFPLLQSLFTRHTPPPFIAPTAVITQHTHTSNTGTPTTV